MATLWMIATLIAAAAQTARNAMQQSLTATIGTIGATQVRFLYGFPFALVFLFGTSFVTGVAVPPINKMTFAFGLSGAIMQIIGTILMLLAMRLRSFAVATAYLKTEPVLVAIAGVLVLGEHLDPYAWLAIVVATTGVVVLTWKPQEGDLGSSWKPALFGIGAGGCFALAAVLFRGGILWLEPAPFDLMATQTFLEQLALQFGKSRRFRDTVAIVGMRVDARTKSAEQLHRFIDGLAVPVVTCLRDTQNYVHLAAHGLTLFDVPSARVRKDRESWQPLVDWLGSR